jgi:hypothetical protein
MLFELLFKREINRINCENLKRAIIILFWEDYTSTRPDNVFLYIANSVIVEETEKGIGLLYVRKIPNYLTLLPSIAKQQEKSFDDTEWSTKFYEKRGFHYSGLLQDSAFQKLVLRCKNSSHFFQ